MTVKIKNGIFISFFIVLILPLIQQSFPFITSAPLFGWAFEAPDVTFSWDLWKEETYQQKKGKYLNDNTGFRPDFIRLNNQLDYSILGKLNAPGIVEGANHCLYLSSYINAYNGRDYVGYEPIREKINKIRKLTDTFARLGKSLIIVYSPSKAYMYPEYIPDSSKNTAHKTTNFETYLRLGDSLKINQLDFNTWFCSMKNNTKELLYTMQGIHWSVYGSLLAADSLIRYMEHLRNIRMPHPVWSKIVHADQPRDSDNDVEKILNLIYPITKETFSYPEVSFTEDSKMVKPKVIYLGDSFLEMWQTLGIPQRTCSDWEIWMWYSTVLHKDGDNPAGRRREDIPAYDWITAMNNADCVVVMFTSINLNIFGHGFFEKAYEYYFPTKSTT